MEFEEYSPRWQRQVRHLADVVFGERYFVKPSDIAREVGSHVIICIDDDQLVGFAHGRLLPRFGLSEFLDRKVEMSPAEIDAADAAGALGVIQSVGVSSERRGEGIGTRLTRMLHDVLVGHGADKLIAVFKRGPGSSRIEGIMQKMNFEFWLRLEPFFRTRCDQGDFKCVLRSSKCNCHALLFRKTVF